MAPLKIHQKNLKNPEVLSVIVMSITYDQVGIKVEKFDIYFQRGVHILE